MNSSRNHHRLQQNAFSLIELLSVTAIIALLVTGSIVAITNLGKSSQLGNGGRTVSNLLTIARAEAISRSTLVRFSVAEAWPGEEGVRRASIWVYSNRELPTTDSAAWTQIGKWEHLAQGISFETDATTIASPLPGTYLFSMGQSNEVNTSVGKVNTRSIEFSPSGTLLLPSSANAPARLRLSDGTSNFVDIGVDRLTGRCSVSRPGEPL